MVKRPNTLIKNWTKRQIIYSFLKTTNQVVPILFGYAIGVRSDTLLIISIIWWYISQQLVDRLFFWNMEQLNGKS